MEMIVSALLFSIITMGIFLVVSVAQRSWFTGDTAVELRQQIINALITMNKELSETSTGQINLTLSVPRTSVTFRIPNDNDGDGDIIDSSGNIEWSLPITYSLSSGNLIRTYSGNSSIMAQNITSLQFENTESKLVQIDMAAQKTDATGKTRTDSEQAVIKMRN